MTIVVAGATGTVGRRIVAELDAAGERVRALSRSPERAALPESVEVVEADLADPESLRPALVGATALHLINFDAGGEHGPAPLRTGPEIVRLAVGAGVERITVLLGAGDGNVEDAVSGSGISWTFLKPVEFMTGALDWAESIRSEGVVREPFVERRSAMVHPADIGAVAAEVLTGEGHSGETYVITGPQSLSVSDKVTVLSEVLGRELKLVEMSEDEARSQWAAAGLPADVVDYLIGAMKETPESGSTVSSTVEAVTGRKPLDFRQWAQENIDAFDGPARR
ncbi:NAD(P)H-binding protein [Actinomycetes bacterium KLBMP 9759]